jgi:hypothetical protein
MYKTTILIQQTTRERLKRIARKDQTYDGANQEISKLSANQPLETMGCSVIE